MPYLLLLLYRWLAEGEMVRWNFRTPESSNQILYGAQWSTCMSWTRLSIHSNASRSCHANRTCLTSHHVTYFIAPFETETRYVASMSMCNCTSRLTEYCTRVPNSEHAVYTYIYKLNMFTCSMLLKWVCGDRIQKYITFCIPLLKHSYCLDVLFTIKTILIVEYNTNTCILISIYYPSVVFQSVTYLADKYIVGRIGF